VRTGGAEAFDIRVVSRGGRQRVIAKAAIGISWKLKEASMPSSPELFGEAPAKHGGDVEGDRASAVEGQDRRREAASVVGVVVSRAST
jgi:hypothetical protein